MLDTLKDSACYNILYAKIIFLYTQQNNMRMKKKVYDN